MNNQWDDDEVRDSNPIATLFWIIVFGFMMVFALYMLVQAIVVETENKEKYYSAPHTQMSEHKCDENCQHIWVRITPEKAQRVCSVEAQYEM